MSNTLPFVGCTIKTLPPEQIIPAAHAAWRINPANRPLQVATAFIKIVLGLHPDDEIDILPPERIALLTSKWFGSGGVHRTVGFVETTTPTLQQKILHYMNRWQERANCSFTLHDGNWQEADTRISRGQGGYWSMLGKDNDLVPRNQQNLNLEGFVLSTPDSEYERVITHETGHQLGCPHEHCRAALVALLNYEATISYFMQTQGWTRDDVIAQVLTPLSESSLMGTPADEDSIMAYQIPGECTLDGQPIRGGTGINESDFAFMAKMYPKAVVIPPAPPPVNPPPVVAPPPGPSPRYTYTIQSDAPCTFTQS